MIKASGLIFGIFISYISYLFFSCSPTTAQTNKPSAETFHAQAVDIPIKQPVKPSTEAPAIVKATPAPVAPDQWSVFSLMLLVCNDPKSEEAPVASKCFNSVMTEWVKLPPDQQFEATSIIKLGQSFYKAEGP